MAYLFLRSFELVAKFESIFMFKTSSLTNAMVTITPDFICNLVLGIATLLINLAVLWQSNRMLEISEIN